MSLLLLFCTVYSNAKRARENIPVVMRCCALYKNSCKYVLNALNVSFFKNCHPPSSSFDMFLYELEEICGGFGTMSIFQQSLYEIQQIKLQEAFEM